MAVKGMTTTVKLSFPIEDGGAKISEITMRRPVVSDEIRKAERQKDGQTEQKVQVLMFADMCSVEEAIISKFDLIDFRKLQQAYNAFFPEDFDGEKSPPQPS